MQFDCDDSSSMLDKGTGQRAGPCTNIEHEVARPNASVGHHLLGPMLMELMPPPACPYPGHGEPSRTSS